MSVQTLRYYLGKLQSHIDLRPVWLLTFMYGVVAFLPFGVFGWLQNEDGLMAVSYTHLTLPTILRV